MNRVYFIKGCLFLATTLVCLTLFSQNKGIIRRHHMTPQEKALKHLIGKDFIKTLPPSGEIRNIAEYEPMQGVLIRYPFGLNYTLISALSQRTTVTTIVASQSQQNTVTNQYQQNGVNLANCDFLIAGSETYWTRDYGPWYITYGNDQIGIVDFIYNRPRPLDDIIPQKMAQFLGIEWFGMDLIHAGGNYMTDGWGISASSDLVITENPTLTIAQIDQKMNEFLGVSTYHKLPDPNNTYIDHIDCWGKYLDVHKVLIREVPTTHPQYDEIEQVADYFASQVSGYGIPYQVYRVYTPNNQPYTNSLIVNNTVYVPIMNSQWDNAAIQTYQQAMPGYEILGFTGSWESTDALHCRTIGTTDLNMLYIRHMPLLGEKQYQPEYDIDTELTAYSGSGIINDSVFLFYSYNGNDFESAQMTYQGDKLYSASIPCTTSGTEISYYIYAVDQSGKRATHPLIGKPDAHTFVAGEQLFPAISLNVTEINAVASSGSSANETAVISNLGQADLEFSISCSTSPAESMVMGLSYVTDFSDWLSVTPVSGLINPGHQQEIVVTCDATLLDPGNYEGFITIASNDPDEPEIIVPVFFHVEIASGMLASTTPASGLHVYPNPVSGKSIISFSLEQQDEISIRLYDLNGRVVALLADRSFVAGDHHVGLNTGSGEGAGLAPGLYFLQFSTSLENTVLKLMVE